MSPKSEQHEAEEGQGFLPDSQPQQDKGLPFNVNFLRSPSQSSKTKKCCRCCTCKCCCIASLVIFVVVAAVLIGGYLSFKAKMDAAMVGGASSENNEVWAETLGNSANGSIVGE